MDEQTDRWKECQINIIDFQMLRESQDITKKCNCDEYAKTETCSAQYMCVMDGQTDRWKECQITIIDFQILHESQDKTLKCNCDEYAKTETCSAQYMCVKVKGQVNYGGGVMSNTSNLITFYDSKNNLNSEVMSLL